MTQSTQTTRGQRTGSLTPARVLLLWAAVPAAVGLVSYWVAARPAATAAAPVPRGSNVAPEGPGSGGGATSRERQPARDLAALRALAAAGQAPERQVAMPRLEDLDALARRRLSEPDATHVTTVVLKQKLDSRKGPAEECLRKAAVRGLALLDLQWTVTSRPERATATDITVLGVKEGIPIPPAVLVCVQAALGAPIEATPPPGTKFLDGFQERLTNSLYVSAR